MATPTVATIKNRYPGRVSKDDSVVQAIIDEAVRLRNTVYSGRIAREGEVEGDEDDFVKYLALHILTLEEGGEVQSETQTGGSVNYNFGSNNQDSTLAETRFGRMALTYIRGEQSIGVELT